MRPPIFASIIGINKYRRRNIKNLHGAVDDARAMKDFLRHKMNVPQDHITMLEDESASREHIIQEFHRLKSDTRIQYGDCIVIYFAGHGSQATAPEGWHSPDGDIQVIFPFDVYCKSRGNVVQPIPDRTLGALLEALAREKGDNIVVIMDCCFSTSGTRSSCHSSDLRLVRSEVVPSNSPLPPNLDQEILTSESFPTRPTTVGLQAHVLIAACSSSELAWEINGRGCFTVALIKLLESCQVETLRYCDIVLRMDIDSTRQSPTCEGFNIERFIFTTKSPQPAREIFIPVYKNVAMANQPTAKLYEYILNGGEAHGLANGDEFNIYSDIDSTELEGTLEIAKVGSFSSLMRRPDSGGVPLTLDSIAIRVERPRRPPLQIYSEICEVLSLLRVQANDDPDIIIVDDPTGALITVSMQCGAVVSHIGTNNIGFRISASSEELVPILKASSKFFSELGRTADFPKIRDHVQVEIYELESSQIRFFDYLSTELVPAACPAVKIDRSESAATVQQATSYGLKLINNSEYDLYPVVQYFKFDASSRKFMYSTLYRPACTEGQLDVPLRKKLEAEEAGFLHLGYGSGGSPPLLIPEGEGPGFLKVSLYTRPLDPFHQAKAFRRAKTFSPALKEPWATINIPVIFPSTPRQLEHPSEGSSEFLVTPCQNHTQSK